MSTVTPAQGLAGPTSAALDRHLARRRPRRRLPRRHARARRHHRAPASTRLFADANAGTDVVVRSADDDRRGDDAVRGAIDAGRRRPGRRRRPASPPRSPSIEGAGQLDRQPTASRSAATARRRPAGNWIDDPTLNPYRLAEGRAPRRRPTRSSIDRGAADDGDLHVGDTTTVLHARARSRSTIVGIATFGDDDGLGPTTYTAFTLPEAHATCSPSARTRSRGPRRRRAGVSRRDAPRRDHPAAAGPRRGDDATELTAEQQQDIDDDFLGMFETFLLAFAGIALVVATFSIHNTFSILVAQRSRESALLRAIGACRAPGGRGRRRSRRSSSASVASAIGLAAGTGWPPGSRRSAPATASTSATRHRGRHHHGRRRRLVADDVTVVSGVAR